MNMKTLYVSKNDVSKGIINLDSSRIIHPKQPANSLLFRYGRNGEHSSRTMTGGKSPTSKSPPPTSPLAAAKGTYVCTCVYMQVCMYILAHTRACVRACTYLYVHIHIFVYAHAHTCMHTQMFVYAHTHKFVYLRITHIPVYANTHTCVCTHTYLCVCMWLHNGKAICMCMFTCTYVCTNSVYING